VYSSSTRRNHLKTFFVASLLLMDIGGLILAFQTAFWSRFHWDVFLRWFPATKGIPELALYQQTLWALLPVFVLVFFYLGFYRDALLSAYDELVLVVRGVVLCALLTTAMSFSFRGIEYSRLMIGLWTVFSVTLLYALRELVKFFFRLLLDRVSGPHHLLILGKGKALEAIREMSHRRSFVRTTFLESVPEVASLREIIERQKVSEILLIQGAISAPVILEVSRLCESIDVDCKVVPDLLEIRRGEIIVDRFCGLPTFHIRPLSLHGTNYYLKRSFDIAISLIVLTVFFIPLAIMSILIRWDTPGPILFRQDRMGWRGRKFKLFKFRTMVANADDLIGKMKHLSDRSGPVFKMKDDPRVTRIGRWLREFSLDELPQIINVLRGDMSLVGPRPQVLWEAAHYDETAKKRLRVMPGITGLWQVSGRAALSYEEMINLDIYYLENWSLGLDLKIMIRTLPAIFAREGAY
jgi:exopolysaccharide biosynthesis polyprenyl glycosylphosphotransferase